MLHSKNILLPVVIISVLFSSCVGVATSGIGSHTTHAARAGTFMPNDIRLNMTMDDFQFLGMQEVSVSYKQYLGFIHFFNEINQQEVARRNVNIVNLNGSSNFPSLRYDTKLLRALYIALVNVPDADFIVPVSIVTQKDQMFMGSIITKKMKVKMYKIKEK